MHGPYAELEYSEANSQWSFELYSSGRLKRHGSAAEVARDRAASFLRDS